MKYILTFLFLWAASLAGIAQMKTPENVPIIYFGKAIDQLGQPVNNAKVSLDLITSHIMEFETDSKSLALTTSEDGTFTLTGVTGYAIDHISIVKSGYELSPKAPHGATFGIVPTYTPDQNNPVIFHMWEKGGKESLISGSKFYGISPDGSPYTIDFLKHEKKRGIESIGDIIVRIKRPAVVPMREKYDWSYSIEPINGGILHTNDEFGYKAPETGYTNKFEETFIATNQNWVAGLRNQQFYIKSRNGESYTSLVVEIIPDYNDKAIFNIQYFVNPSHSRNLER